MHKFTVEDPAGFSVGSGEIIGLSAEQLATRSHRVEVLDEKPGAVTRVRVLEAVQFKAGETLHLDRAPKDGAGTAPAAKAPPATRAKKEKRDENGDTPEMAELRKQFDASWAKLKGEFDTARADGVKKGRAEMLAEVVARNALWDEVDAATEAANAAHQAHDAEADDAKRAPLKEKLAAALQRKVAAETAVKDLPELKA